MQLVLRYHNALDVQITPHIFLKKHFLSPFSEMGVGIVWTCDTFVSGSVAEKSVQRIWRRTEQTGSIQN